MIILLLNNFVSLIPIVSLNVITAVKIKTAIKLLTATDLQLRSSNQHAPQIALVERLFIRIAMLLKN